jgi:hypothetical protein
MKNEIVIIKDGQVYRIGVTRGHITHDRPQPRDSSLNRGHDAAQLAPYLQCGLPRSRGRSAPSLAIRVHAI